MHASQAVSSFTVRHPFIGPAVWVLSIQYFVVQWIAARAWKTPFSIIVNPISDLGNTECGMYASRYVCSPLYNLMNTSFIMLGITMALGSLLIYQGFKKNLGALVGFSFMAAAGAGTILVGLFPENTDGSWHTIGAALPFLIGNIALVILGATLEVPKILKYYTIFSGLLALVALSLFVSKNYLGLGEGGLERLVAYPQTIWLIVFGVYISSNRLINSYLAHTDR